MSNWDWFWMILGMFLVTYSTRAVFFIYAHRIKIPYAFNQALQFAPVTILTAIIVPMILMPGEGLLGKLSSPWVLGAVTSFILGLMRKAAFVTIGWGIVAFVLTRFLFDWT